VQCWYGFYFAALSCLHPYVNICFRRLGLSERSIGLLGTLRPFISLPAGSIWSGVADKSRRHRAVLLFVFCASVLARLALAPLGRLGFAPLLAGVSLAEFFAAPCTIIVDAGAPLLRTAIS
jgi:PPP family 3-phenylpropionic acid transporter